MSTISTIITPATSISGNITSGGTTNTACIGDSFIQPNYNPFVFTDNQIQVELLQNGYLITRGKIKYCATSHEEIGKIILILKETI